MAANNANAMKGFMQGFMQDNIIASHTCFGAHMDVTNNVYGFGRRFLLLHFFTCPPEMEYSCTRVRVLFEYSYLSTKESNRTCTRVHYQSNRTHDYFSRLHFFHMNSCKQIY